MTLEGLLFVNSDGLGTLAAPRVGRFHATVAPGRWLAAADPFGHLEILGRLTPLLVPPTDRVFQVTAIIPPPWEPVDYKSPLIRLSLADASAPTASAAALAPADGLPPDALPLFAPTDGLFYAAPSPDDPPFIREGDVIAPGKVIGLIEVMKFFYEITFDRPGFAHGARVVRVVARSGEPVSTGAPVAWVVPA